LVEINSVPASVRFVKLRTEISFDIENDTGHRRERLFFGARLGGFSAPALAARVPPDPRAPSDDRRSACGLADVGDTSRRWVGDKKIFTRARDTQANFRSNHPYSSIQ